MVKECHTNEKKKYINIAALIGIGFLWTGTAYIMQAYRLLQFLDGRTVNLLVCGIYYVCQAAGISIVSFLFAKYPLIGGGRALPFFTTVIMVIFTAACVFSSSLSIIIISGILINLTIGVLSGCYLTRLATDISQQRRGLIFGIAYAFGSIFTWLLSLPMDGKFLWNSGSFFAVALLAAVSLFLLRYLPKPPEQSQGIKQLSNGSQSKLILLAASVLFLLSLENTLGFSFPLKSASGSVYIEFTRVFYAIGLIVAGIISDRNRRWGAMCCLAALAFPLAALALGSSVVGETAMWIMAYLFLGFWAAYRIILFSDLAAKTGFFGLAVIGLLIGRIGEAAGTVGVAVMSGMPLIILAYAVFAIVIALFFSLYHKIYSPVINAEDAHKKKLSNYAHFFKFSPREQEIFNLIVQGMSNAEIANSLYITESTVKFHAGNIFKKTGMSNRSELIANYKLEITI